MQVYNCPDAQRLKQLAIRPTLPQEELSQKIKAIFESVAENGDKALFDYTEQFDGVTIDAIKLPKDVVRELADKTPSALRRAIDQAAANIKAFHLDQLKKTDKIETMPGVTCWQESRPIEKAGLYIPGGSAPLISTVLMLGVPAQLAGCREVLLCTPPDASGEVNAAICYAALKVGVTKLVRVGGAQAIAALTLGTESVTKVDKIFGPGNQYVTAAKQVAVKYGVAIDMPAGPSEIMVVADRNAKPEFVAADLLSQAEHGLDSQVVLLTDDSALLKAVLGSIKQQLKLLPRKDIARTALQESFCLLLPGLETMLAFANLYAPEHLILAVRRPREAAKKVINAGSVFLGAYSPESVGDYASGTNHTLPTNGWARSYGGVSVASFCKQVTFQSITKTGLKNLAPTVLELAQAEGLEAHARAVTIRLAGK